MNNLNIMSIQTNKDELVHQLNGMNLKNTNILFTNCTSSLQIDKNFIYPQINTCFYEGENYTLALYSDTQNNPKQYLENLNIPFTEVAFANSDNSNEEFKLKEILFIKSKEELEHVVNTKVEGTVSSYFPNIESNLFINYPTNEDLVCIGAMELKGVIVTDDKVAFIVKNKPIRQIEDIDVISYLMKCEHAVEINYSKNFPQELLEKGNKKGMVLCKKN